MSTLHFTARRAVRGLTGLAAFTLTVAAAPLLAQVPVADAPEYPADPADVESIDAIMTAVYDVISGPAGEVRDWDRMRSLFVDGARLIPTGRDPSGTPRMGVWSVDEYITRAGPVLEEGGFFEVEVGRVTEQYGNVVHLMSAYESRWNEDDPEPFTRGVNSFQLWNDGERWWVVSIMWEDERSAGVIPKRYLGTHDHSTGADHSMHGMDAGADHNMHGMDTDESSEGADHDNHAGHDADND